MEQAKEFDCVISIEDQRILLSTLSSIFFDLMSGKVKEMKLGSSLSSEGPTEPFSESTVSLYRYAGFALHSMIEVARKAVISSPTITQSSDELELLEALKCKPNEIDDVPIPVKDLGVQRFTIISPSMIPFVRVLLKNIMSCVSEKDLEKHGNELIKVAKSKVIGEVEVIEQ